MQPTAGVLDHGHFERLLGAEDCVLQASLPLLVVRILIRYWRPPSQHRVMSPRTSMVLIGGDGAAFKLKCLYMTQFLSGPVAKVSFDGFEDQCGRFACLPPCMAYSSMSLSKTENFNRRQKGCCRSCLRGFVRSLNVVLMVVGVGFLAYGGSALHLPWVPASCKFSFLQRIWALSRKASTSYQVLD